MARSKGRPRSGNREADLRPPVVFVPGGIMPAAFSYGPLLEVLGDEARVHLKDLEVYAGEAPPSNYGLNLEVEGVARAADEAGLETFHLVGYSGGGAVALAFTARHPERVRSLALVEPAWIGHGDESPEEQAYWAAIDALLTLPPEERMQQFTRVNLRPGVEMPARPSGPMPPWMAKRPSGLMAMVRAFRASDLARTELCQFEKPVYLAIGSLSHPVEERKAETLASLFPEIRVEVYQGLHHFAPPHIAAAARFALALRDLWMRADTAAPLRRNDQPFIVESGLH